MVKAAFIVIDKDTGRNVHGIHKNQALSDPALFEALINLWRDVDELHAFIRIEPELLAIGFHFL
jgi:hypothetical protein